MKIAQYGIAIVVIHEIVNGLHGLAHIKIPAPLSLLQSSFVVLVIFLAAIIAAILLWTRFYRIGIWFLLNALIGSILVSTYIHLIAMSPAHISQVSWSGWGLLFYVTAILSLVIDGLGCWLYGQALKSIRQSQGILADGGIAQI
ncbi:hypothetical protein [Nostoc sp. ChiVER01]|uniref:hypothetical protein n=1 Tax=Nostoc sp. ChiVER01 TaxID=3075382 RepID=UPI002AD396B6|nr:hypothetical protein [Nostoc sp. ChiVER01]MDZ8224075.1 hypothetical protein [Nostoc sp. ChiVER01]